MSWTGRKVVDARPLPLRSIGPAGMTAYPPEQVVDLAARPDILVRLDLVFG
jgi:hypothetical protein